GIITIRCIYILNDPAKSAANQRRHGIDFKTALALWGLSPSREVYRLRFTNSQTLEITTDPSPTEEATRLTEPARTSPTAKIPGSEVAKGEAAPPVPEPVTTNPLSSSFTRPESHSVLGAAPTMMN